MSDSNQEDLIKKRLGADQSEIVSGTENDVKFYGYGRNYEIEGLDGDERNDQIEGGEGKETINDLILLEGQEDHRSTYPIRVNALLDNADSTGIIVLKSEYELEKGYWEYKSGAQSRWQKIPIEDINSGNLSFGLGRNSKIRFSPKKNSDINSLQSKPSINLQEFTSDEDTQIKNLYLDSKFSQLAAAWLESEKGALTIKRLTSIDHQITDDLLISNGEYLVVDKPFIQDLENGNIALVWQEYHPNWDSKEIYFQAFDQRNNPISDQILINTLKTKDQINPKISTFKDNHNIAIAWVSENSSEQTKDIYLQLLNDEFQKIGSNQLVEKDVQNSDLAMTSLSDNTVLIGYHKDNNLLAKKFTLENIDDIQKLDPFQLNDKNATHTNWMISSGYDGTQGYVPNKPNLHLESFPNNGFIATWADQDTAEPGRGLGQTNIFTAIHDNDGNAVDIRTNEATWNLKNKEVRVNLLRDDNQNHAISYALSDELFVVVWQSRKGFNIFGSRDDLHDYDIFARLFDRKGSPITDEFQVNNDPIWQISLPKLITIGFMIIITAEISGQLLQVHPLEVL